MFLQKKTKQCRDDACKSKGTRLEKVKEQDGMTLAKVKHYWSAKYPYICGLTKGMALRM